MHSCHLHAPFRGRFAPNSLNAAHYAALIRDKSPTKCDAHLTESNFQTRSSNRRQLTCIREKEDIHGTGVGFM
ncbi:DUF6783 domain-containing protein [Hungatella effluvii]|uniref:DUF6783 domain-containing protein n=1 Tax=Hungatella effluvii TaxID=1096246 RepID=UPI003D810968